VINLCYCVNEGIFKGILMSLVSASEVSKDALNVTVLTGDFSNLSPKFKPFSEKQRAFLEKNLKAKNPLSSIHLIDCTSMVVSEMKDSPNLLSSYTPYIFLRLFLDRIGGLPDKILYLDADTIVMKDLSLLFSVDLGDKDLGWVRDAYGRWLISPNYCNSGVLLLNLPAIKKDHLFERCLQKLKNRHYPFPDQDVLNKCGKGHTVFLSGDFNEQKKLKETTIIRHYCNQPRIFPYVHALIAKPWDLERIHKVYRITALDRLHEECQYLWKEYEHE
jgi:lipopolysaccharide biosynthesis glycosyltransferase